MKDFHGKRVLITGGASGIGKLMGDVLGVISAMEHFTGRKNSEYGSN